MIIEFNLRKNQRRKTPCFISKDRRKAGRHGATMREFKRKRLVEFERHLKAQR